MLRITGCLFGIIGSLGLGLLVVSLLMLSVEYNSIEQCIRVYDCGGFQKRAALKQMDKDPLLCSISS